MNTQPEKPSSKARREDRRWNVSPLLVERQRGRIASVMADALTGFPPLAPHADASALQRLNAEFETLYPERPVRDNTGGAMFNSSLWIWLVAKLLAPAHIVESGVHKGHSTWLLRQAAPDAEIVGFDIELERRAHVDPRAEYNGRDWSEVKVSAPAGAVSLAFFDDHVNQCRRVAEAHARGYRMLLFDDNFPADQLYATGVPPAPTLAMLRDPEIVDGTTLEWVRHGKPQSLTYREAETHGAAELIAHYLVLPDLSPLNGYFPQAHLTLVALRN